MHFGGRVLGHPKTEEAAAAECELISGRRDALRETKMEHGRVCVPKKSISQRVLSVTVIQWLLIVPVTL